jgi:hypothetical protein
MPSTLFSTLYPNAITSPFPEKCFPRAVDTERRYRSRDLRRISVEPSVPDARNTMPARIGTSGDRNSREPRSRIRA